jgi:hypothetical protein
MNAGEAAAATGWLVPATAVFLVRQPGDCEPAVGDRSRSLLLGDSLLLCALQMSCLEVRVVPTD